jgi:hypothetical protein
MSCELPEPDGLLSMSAMMLLATKNSKKRLYKKKVDFTETQATERSFFSKISVCELVLDLVYS